MPFLVCWVRGRILRRHRTSRQAEAVVACVFFSTSFAYAAAPGTIFDSEGFFSTPDRKNCARGVLHEQPRARDVLG